MLKICQKISRFRRRECPRSLCRLSTKYSEIGISVWEIQISTYEKLNCKHFLLFIKTHISLDNAVKVHGIHVWSLYYSIGRISHAQSLTILIIYALSWWLLLVKSLLKSDKNTSEHWCKVLSILHRHIHPIRWIEKKEFSEQISQYKLLPDHNSNPRINIENWSENKFNTCIQFFINFILSIPNITPLYFIFLCYATMNIPLVQVYICPILIDYKVLSFWDLINYVCKYEDSKLKYIMTKWS